MSTALNQNPVVLAIPKDGGHEKIEVNIRELKIKELVEYSQVLEDEVKRLAFVTNLTEEQVEDLPEAVHISLLEKDDEVNFPTWERWIERKMKVMGRMTAPMESMPSSMKSALATAASRQMPSN